MGCLGVVFASAFAIINDLSCGSFGGCLALVPAAPSSPISLRLPWAKTSEKCNRSISMCDMHFTMLGLQCAKNCVKTIVLAECDPNGWLKTMASTLPSCAHMRATCYCHMWNRPCILMLVVALSVDGVAAYLPSETQHGARQSASKHLCPLSTSICLQGHHADER